MNGYWTPVVAPSPMKWKWAHTTCVGWCLLSCVWGRGATTKLSPHAVRQLRLTLLERGLHPTFILLEDWLLQGPAANASSVAPLIAAKTELCCNEHKGSSLLNLLNAYRPCNSCWLSDFQTGCLVLPHKVSLSLGLATAAAKGLTKERPKFSVLWVLFTGVFFCHNSPHTILDAFCSKAYFYANYLPTVLMSILLAQLPVLIPL